MAALGQRGAKKKLSMSAFKELRQARALLEEGERLREQGDVDGARAKFELAVEASADAVEARVVLAQELWDCASSQEALGKVEALLAEARLLAREASSAPEAAQEGVASSKLARLLIQQGRDADATPLLVENGYTHRLSTQVLCGGRPPVIQENQWWGDGVDGGVSGKSREDVLSIFDEVLPESMLLHLQRLFDNDAAFWREHRYFSRTTGYFSYTHRLDCPPQSNLDQIMHFLWRRTITKFPNAARATRVEWWAHNRPHPSGHQLHFDSDNEGLGGVRNPLATSVCSLSQDIHTY